MAQESTGKIAELTPEIVQGLGDKYQPEDLTPEALDALLAQPTAGTTPRAPEAEPAAQTVETEPAATETPTEVPPETEAKPETDPQAKAKKPSLKEAYYEKSNALNHARQMQKNQEALLQKMLEDPAEYFNWREKQLGANPEMRMVKDGKGNVDMSNPTNQREIQRVLEATARAAQEAKVQVEQLKAQEQQRIAEAESRKYLDKLAEEFGQDVIEDLGESFADADLNWVRVYGELGEEQAGEFLKDPSKFSATHPHLRAPRNPELYFRLVNSVKAAEATGMSLSPRKILEADGYRPSKQQAKLTPERAAAVLDARKEMEVQGRTTIANPNIGDKGALPQEVASRRFDDVIAKFNAGKKLEPAEQALLDAALGL